MALIDCPECGARVSDKALACPKCGWTNNPENLIGKNEDLQAREIEEEPVIKEQKQVVPKGHYDFESERSRKEKKNDSVNIGVAIFGLLFFFLLVLIAIPEDAYYECGEWYENYDGEWVKKKC